MFNHVQADHVERAADTLRHEGIPARRNSRGWTVVVRGQNYPPKYLMSVACRYAADDEPGCWDVHTNDAVRRLRQLDYDVHRV
jgi:hypothetical protein